MKKIWIIGIIALFFLGSISLTYADDFNISIEDYGMEWVKLKFLPNTLPYNESGFTSCATCDARFVNVGGDTMTGNLDMNGNSLTNVGELIVNSISLKGNLTPYTDDLYSIGNSTNWIKEIWVKNIYSENINASEINSTDVNTKNLGADKGDIENMTTEEINLGDGVRMMNRSGDMVVILS